MDLEHFPYDARLAEYEHLAEQLIVAQAARDAGALECIRKFDPRFRRATVTWLARDVPLDELASTPFEREHARATVARSYDFADWSALEAWVTDVARGESVTRFEEAVEAVVDGDLARLRRMLAAHPELVHARSTRRTSFDPPVHAATLLHYLAANGVEGSRQRTPPNAVAVMAALLDAGAEPDALGAFYGGTSGTLMLLVSSSHPAAAGLQVDLARLLVLRGASLEGRGERWGSPLRTALIFGFPATAEALAALGARVQGLADAAGLGHRDTVTRLLPAADAAERHMALALGAQLGRADVVGLLLDAGEDPDRYNPEDAHPHATPLHQAVWGGHMAVVELLLERGARLDLSDRIYGGTPLDWARHGHRAQIEARLRSAGA